MKVWKVLLLFALAALVLMLSGCASKKYEIRKVEYDNGIVCYVASTDFCETISCVQTK